MSIRSILIATAAMLPAQCAWTACIPLAPGAQTTAVTSRTSSACFLVVVEPGLATQVKVEQPEDLEIHLAGDGKETLVDGFDFGTETVTIDVPGEYRLSVRLVASLATSPSVLRFHVSRHELDARRAAARRSADEWATKSKQSQKAEDVEESLRQWSALGDWPAIARTRIKMGDAVLPRDPAAALEAYEAALTICDSIADMRCKAEAEHNSGWAALRLGDFDRSLQRLNAGIGQWRRLGLPRFEGIALSNLGLLFQQAGDLQSATNAFDQAKSILQSRDPVAYAWAVHNLGLCYLQSADYDKARAQLEEALACFLRTRNSRDAARARLNLGRTYLLDGRISRSQSVLEEALAAVQDSERSTRADILDNLGQLFWKRHLLEPAESNLRQALALHESISDKRWQAYDLYYLGRIAQERGDFSAARDLMTRALQLRTAAGLRDNVSESQTALAQLEFAAGNLSQAREWAEQALQLQESVRSQVPPNLRASFYSRKRNLFDLLVDIAMKPENHDASAGLLASERGRARALLDLLAEGSLVRRTEGHEFELRSKAQQRIGLLSASLGGATGARQAVLRNQLELAIAEDEAAERRIRESLSDLPMGKPLDSVEQLREKLPANSAILEYHLGERNSYLWLMERADVRVFLLPSRETVEEQANAAAGLFGRILDRRRSPQKQAEFQRGMEKLSATLLGPMKGIVLPERLILVLDGALHRVPFAALPYGPGNEPLGLARDLVQAPSAGYLDAGRKPRPPAEFPRTILALADPVFSADDGRVQPGGPRRRAGALFELVRLPFTADLDTIERLVPPARRRILKGFDVNLAAVERMRLADFGVIAFSTHALIDDRIPEISRIALSQVDRSGRPVDGFLRPYQLGRFSLDGSVVVLSACDTALGKQVLGEGLMGLTSSLFSAGAAQLVLTLTAVDGEGSAEFLSETYRRFLARNPVPLEHAMREARRSLARPGRWSDPYYWASFIVMGRPAE